MNRRNALRTLAASAVGLGFSPQLLAQILQNPTLQKSDFGNDFLWGVATAAYQIEGAHNVDGKGVSIWDTFSHQKKKIKTGENGDITCDFYHRYPTDIALIKEMNFNVNRFSVAWTRIFPDGKGNLNQKGIDFYHKVIDRTLELGLQPWITLYHWDLPQALEDQGGWTNRDVVARFSEYADAITRAYGDKVKNWMVLNEPMAYTGLGYFMGIHAPGRRSPWAFMKACHHTSLAQAEGGRIIRKNVKNAEIGTTFSCSHIDAIDNKEKNQNAAIRADALFNRLFLEPALGMGYPMKDLPFLHRMEKYIQAGDMEKLPFDFDFIGLQNYTRHVAKHHPLIPFIREAEVPAKKRNVPFTEMGWEVYPEGIYQLLKKFGSYKNIKKIIVTENGAAFPDEVVNGKVADKERIAFFEAYLAKVLQAQQEGVPVKGYFVWTLMDNFEWAEGYHPRFGLVHIDFKTQQRTMKDSGRWFQSFLK